MPAEVEFSEAVACESVQCNRRVKQPLITLYMFFTDWDYADPLVLVEAWQYSTCVEKYLPRDKNNLPRDSLYLLELPSMARISVVPLKSSTLLLYPGVGPVGAERNPLRAMTSNLPCPVISTLSSLTSIRKA